MVQECFAVHHRDCLEGMAELPDASIDVVLTDPPFSSGTRKEGQKGIRKSMKAAVEDRDWFGTDSLTAHGFIWLMRSCAVRWKRLVKRGGHILIFIDWRMYPHLSAAVESADLRHVSTLVWDKQSFGMGFWFRNQHEFILHFSNGRGRDPRRRDVPNVLSFPPVRNGSHHNEKPVPLLRELLSVVAGPEARVLDPFCGSGSVGVACRQLGLSFIGFDNDPASVANARYRIQSSPQLVRGQSCLAFGD